MQRILSLFVLVLLLGGCVKVHTVTLAPEQRPPHPASEVQLLAKIPEGRPYVALARMVASSDLRDWETMKRKLVDRAAAMGADALIVGPLDSESDVFGVSGNIINATARRLEVIAIAWKDPK